ncbi:MAG: tRNA-dihydrouridine synthase [Ignavibacteria bacterium]
MKIGELDLGRRAILAPMADVTDAPFRKIAREQGAGLTFTQMISAKGIIDNVFRSLKALAFNRSEKPIGIQLLGRDESYIYNAIQDLKSLNPDVIDLNCGCSVQDVCKYGLGAAILDEPELLGRLVKTMVRAAGNIPVSVKIRLGRTRQKINVIENAKIIEGNGASFITVHARVRNDKYIDEPLWHWIGKVKQAVSIPVIGNGSLFSADECIRMIDETGCDSVFIARGAIGNPFIFKRLNLLMETGIDPGLPHIDEVKKVALKHLHLLKLDSGEEMGVRKAYKNLIWYFRFYNGISQFIEDIFSFNDLKALEEFIEAHCERIKNNLYSEEDLGKITQDFNNRVLFWAKETKS